MKNKKESVKIENPNDMTPLESLSENVESVKLIKLSSENKNLPKASTDIPQLDDMIQGGFHRNSINLVVGGSGSGKTVIALQFLMAGLKRGENVLYISFEEQKSEFFSNMSKFGYDLYEAEKSGKFIYLQDSPEKVKVMLDEGGGTIETLVLKNKISRMVIDSISSFSLLFEDEFAKKQANLDLFDIIRKWKVTTLLTLQHDPSLEVKHELTSIQFEVDSIILLYHLNEKGHRKRYLEVLKMRGTHHSRETKEFELSNKGITFGRITTSHKKSSSKNKKRKTKKTSHKKKSNQKLKNKTSKKNQKHKPRKKKKERKIIPLLSL